MKRRRLSMCPLLAQVTWPKNGRVSCEPDWLTAKPRHWAQVAFKYPLFTPGTHRPAQSMTHFSL